MVQFSTCLSSSSAPWSSSLSSSSPLSSSPTSLELPDSLSDSADFSSAFFSFSSPLSSSPSSLELPDSFSDSADFSSAFFSRPLRVSFELAFLCLIFLCSLLLFLFSFFFRCLFSSSSASYSRSGLSGTSNSACAVLNSSIASRTLSRTVFSSSIHLSCCRFDSAFRSACNLVSPAAGRLMLNSESARREFNATAGWSFDRPHPA